MTLDLLSGSTRHRSPTEGEVQTLVELLLVPGHHPSFASESDARAWLEEPRRRTLVCCPYGSRAHNGFVVVGPCSDRPGYHRCAEIALLGTAVESPGARVAAWIAGAAAAQGMGFTDLIELAPARAISVGSSRVAGEVLDLRVHHMALETHR